MDELLKLLGDISSGESNAVNSATFKLAQLYKNPMSLVFLIEIVCSSHNLSLRQLSAIEARKNVKAFWPKIQEELKFSLKEKLLAFILTETE